jgi:outer membrane protein TolC
MNRALTRLAWLTLGLCLLIPGSLWSQEATKGVDLPLQTVVAGSSHPNQSSATPQLPAEKVSLQNLLQVALARNPAIKSATEQFEAKRARVPQARSLPDPTVSGGWMGNITPFNIQRGDPSSYRSLTVAEEFPYPGKLKLRGQIADRDAQAAWWDYEQTRRQVIANVKVAYYNYFYYTTAIAITEKNKDLLQKLESIAEALYRVGKGIQQDVLRAQVEVSRIDQRLIVLHQQEYTARVRLNTLLDQDPESPLASPASFTTAEFRHTLDELYAMARQNDPGLERDRRLIEGGRSAVNLAQKAYYPDFSVAYTYLQRPSLPDMHGFTLGINIPIFYRTKQREGVIEASHNLNSAHRELDNRLTSVNFEVKQQYLAATASRDLTNLYSKAIVPQSSLALESSMSAYGVGKLDFLSVLTNFTNVLDYEVSYYQELSNYQIALSSLEPLVGVELTK